MKLILLIISISISFEALSQDEERKHQLNHFKACEHLLSDISIEQSNIFSNRKSIAQNYKQFKTTKEPSRLIKLREISEEDSDDTKERYSTLANIVSIYKAIECDKKDLVKELGCPKDWSSNCR
jgi:hypothetical protein